MTLEKILLTIIGVFLAAIALTIVTLKSMIDVHDKECRDRGVSSND